MRKYQLVSWSVKYSIKYSKIEIEKETKQMFIFYVVSETYNKQTTTATY